MQPIINKTVLMSGVDYFDDQAAINPFMDASVAIDMAKASQEHAAIRRAFEQAGLNVVKVDPPADCQDGVYTANWALVRGNKAVMANLPNAREAEQAYAESILRDHGKQIIKLPQDLHFSGQGDALPCGNYLLCGSGYRSDAEAQRLAAEALGLERVQLQTVPQLDESDQPIINSYSGWADSFFYDIDLAISILKWPDDNQPGLIAWCPEAFLPDSQAKIRSLNLDKIEVSLDEAVNHFACNLVSTGQTVIMSDSATELKANIESHGLKTITPPIKELVKGGGYIRCTSLTLDNN